jgi:AcrR family transcriptional regulator
VIDRAIVAAARQLLLETGYGGLTLEAVAKRAGVSRPAIYRRYQNKAALVIDLVAQVASVDATHEGIAPRLPQTGTLRGDLVGLLGALEASFDALVAQGIAPGMLAELIAHPDLAAEFFRDYLDPAQQSVRQIFSEAMRRGEIAEQPVPEVLISMLVGAYIYQRFVICQGFTLADRETLATLLSNALRGPS